MNGPELPPELQADQDLFYAESMGPIETMLFVDEWHSTSAAGIALPNGDRAWFHLLNVYGPVGPNGEDPVSMTIAFPLDICRRIGTNMIRVSHLSKEELEQESRRVGG